MKTKYHDLIQRIRRKGKVFIPIDFGAANPNYVSIEKKDLIEGLEANFAVSQEVWQISHEDGNDIYLGRVSNGP